MANYGFRLSHQQQYLWDLRRQYGNGPFRMACLLHLQGKISDSEIEERLSDIIAKHEILRTEYSSIAGTDYPLQVIKDEISYRFIRSASSVSEEHSISELWREVKDCELSQGQGNSVYAHYRALADNTALLLLSLSAFHCDRYGMSLFFKELFLAPSESADENDFIQYADYAEWQHDFFNDELSLPSRQFWSERSLSYNPVSLPFMRSEMAQYIPEALTVELSVDQTQSFVALVDSWSVTIEHALFTIWCIVLCRMLDKTDVVVNAGCSGREYKDLRFTIGPLMRYLPLSVRINESQDFRNLCLHLSNIFYNAREHTEGYPGAANRQSNCSSIDFDFDQLEATELPELRIREIYNWFCGNVAELRLSATHYVGHTIRLSLCYNRALFSDRSAEVYLSQLKNFFEHLLINPQVPVSKLYGIDIPQVMRGPAITHNASKNIVDKFRQQVANTPTHIAIRYRQTSITYQDFDCKTDQLARYLLSITKTQQTVTASTPIMILLDNGLLWMQAIFAVLKAGVAYVPVEGDTPPERLRNIREAVGCKTIVTQMSLMSVVEGVDCSAIAMDDDFSESWASVSDQGLPVSQALPQIAYIIFTSGSTGKPKGVAVSHNSLLHYVESLVYSLKLQNCERYAHVSSFATDLGYSSIFPALLTGASVTVVDASQRLDSEMLQRVISAADCLKIAPTHLTALLDTSLNPRQVLPQKKLILGGEVLHWPLVERIKALSAGLELFNHYGPTETTVGVITCRVHADMLDFSPKSAPIGKPLPHVRCQILNSDGQPVGIGIPGELYISGACLSEGYVNQVTLNERHFVSLPEGEGWGRYYRSGDRVRLLPDGNLEFLGRLDRQIKINGHRVELSEIEYVCRQFNAIDNVVAAVIDHKHELQRLAVFYKVESQAQVSEELLAEYLAKQLPFHMRPSLLVRVDKLPINASGKLDMQVVASLIRSAKESSIRQYCPPDTPTEKLLAAIWSEILDVSEVGTKDNYFELGGDSILAIQIVSRAKEKSIEFTPQELFEYKTIGRLAEVVRVYQPVKPEQSIITGEIPLTPIQHWFFEQSVSSPQHWNMSLLLKLDANVDTEAMQKAFNHVLQHHDALRIYFINSGNGWNQYNAADLDFQKIEVIEITDSDDIQGSEQLSQHAALVQTSFNLEEPPLVRVCVYRNSHEARMLVVVHHLIMDGVSWRVLLESLYDCYTKIRRTQTVELPDKTSSFKQWAEELCKYAIRQQGEENKEPSAVFNKEVAYWQSMLSSPAARLPIDFSRGANTVASAAAISLSLTQAETEMLVKDSALFYHAQLRDVLISALWDVFSKLMQCHSILIELEGHGREPLFRSVETDKTIGWFTARYPLLLTFTNDNTTERESYLNHLLQEIKEQLRLVPLNGLSFGILRYLSGRAVRSKMEKMPIPELSFNYMGHMDRVFPESWQLSRKYIGSERCADSIRTQLIAIDAMIIDGQLTFHWQYSRHKHAESTIRQIAEGCMDVLREFIAYCAQRRQLVHYTPSDFPVANLEQSELDNILLSYAQAGKYQLSLAQQLLVLHGLWENMDSMQLRLLLKKFSVEDIYTLSPMQQGMLFDCIFDSSSELYVQQKVITLRGSLGSEAIQYAWRQVAARYSALRSVFVWKNLKIPHQVILAQNALQFTHLDLRGQPAYLQKNTLETFLSKDKARGFDLAKPPLMRIALCSLSENLHLLIWTHHHLILDGWCNSIILDEVLTLAQAFGQSKEVKLRAKIRPFRDFIDWCKSRPGSIDELYWKNTLSGVSLPTPIPGYRGTPAGKQRQRNRQLSAAATAQLQHFAQKQGVTLSLLLNSTWALILYLTSQEKRVVFGVTLAGRTPELEDVDTVVGVLMNVAPLRIDIDPSATVMEWLLLASVQQSSMLEHQYNTLAAIRTWSGFMYPQRLFDSLITFENYPVKKSLTDVNQALYIDRVEAPVLARYPIVITAEAGEYLDLTINSRNCSEQLLDDVFDLWLTLLESIPLASSKKLQHWLDEIILASKIANTGKSINLNIGEFNADLELKIR